MFWLVAVDDDGDFIERVDEVAVDLVADFAWEIQEWALTELVGLLRTISAVCGLGVLLTTGAGGLS
jgi:hypothetical protein